MIKYAVSSIANKFVSATLLVAAGTLAPVFVVVLAYLDPAEQETPQLSCVRLFCVFVVFVL